MSLLSMAVMSGCGMVNQLNDKLANMAPGGLGGNKETEAETSEEYLEFEEETSESDEFTDESETFADSGSSNDLFNYYDDTTNTTEITDSGYTEFSDNTTETGANTPMYSAEYYFSKLSDMELPEGATADEYGNIHYNGYRLVRQERDLLPATAVVGAPINYEVYVNALPEDNVGKSNNSQNDDYLEEDEEDSYQRTLNDNVNRVQQAVQDAMNIKNNVEDDTYDSISKNAASNIGKNSETEETQPFIPTIPDEDPEYDGKLVSVKRNEVQNGLPSEDGPVAQH